MDNPLSQKLGPLPVWSWGLIAAGALYGYNWWTGKNAATPPAPNQADSTWVPTDTTPVDVSGQTGDASGMVFSPSLPTGGTQAPSTPEGWASIVSDWLIGNGAPVAVVQSAFAKLIRIINGDLPANSLTAQEAALVSQGVAHFGSPPTGPVQYGVSPAPGTPTGSLPSAMQSHIAPGKLDQVVEVRDFARAVVPKAAQGDANVVEQQVRYIRQSYTIQKVPSFRGGHLYTFRTITGV